MRRGVKKFLVILGIGAILLVAGKMFIDFRLKAQRESMRQLEIDIQNMNRNLENEEMSREKIY